MTSDTKTDSDIITLGAIDCSNFCLKCYEAGRAWFIWRENHIRNTLQVLAPEPETKGPPLDICDNCALYIIQVVFLNTISFEDAETGAIITASTSGSNTPTPPSPPATPPNTTIAAAAAAPADNNTGAGPNEPNEPNIIRVATISPESTTTTRGGPMSTTNSGSNFDSVEPTSHKRQQRSTSPRCPKRNSSIDTRLGNKQPTLDDRLGNKQPSIDDRLGHHSPLQKDTRDRRDYSRSSWHSYSSSSSSADRRRRERRQRLLDHGHSYTTTYEEIIKNAYRNY